MTAPTKQFMVYSKDARSIYCTTNRQEAIDSMDEGYTLAEYTLTKAQACTRVNTVRQVILFEEEA